MGSRRPTCASHPGSTHQPWEAQTAAAAAHAAPPLQMRRPTEAATATQPHGLRRLPPLPPAPPTDCAQGGGAPEIVRRRPHASSRAAPSTRPTALPSSGGTATHDGGEDMPATNVHWLFLGVHLQRPWFPFSGSRV